jgi:hypothetical protein
LSGSSSLAEGKSRCRVSVCTRLNIDQAVPLCRCLNEGREW